MNWNATASRHSVNQSLDHLQLTHIYQIIKNNFFIHNESILDHTTIGCTMVIQIFWQLYILTLDVKFMSFVSMLMCGVWEDSSKYEGSGSIKSYTFDVIIFTTWFDVMNLVFAMEMLLEAFQAPKMSIYSFTIQTIQNGLYSLLYM